MNPMYEDILEIPETYPEGKLLFGIDIGGSLTKLAFLEKNDGSGKFSVQERPSRIRMLTFPNGNVEEVMVYIKDEIFKLEEYPAKLIGIGSGVGSLKHKKTIDRILGTEITKCDEFDCFGAGFHYCMKNIQKEEFIEPFEDPDISKLPTEGISKGNPKDTKSADSGKTDSDIYPAIMCFIGSACGFLRLEEDGSSKMVMGLGLGGLYYHSLGKLLTRCETYEELLELAKKGNAEKVNVLLEELIPDQYGEIDTNSLATAVPYKMEGYPFGRIVREGLEPTREDLSRALLNDCTMNILFWCMNVCKTHGVDKCYFAGSFLRNNDPFREYTNTRLPYMSSLMGQHPVVPRIFKFNGYPGVLGAVIKLLDDIKNTAVES